MPARFIVFDICAALNRSSTSMLRM